MYIFKVFAFDGKNETFTVSTDSLDKAKNIAYALMDGVKYKSLNGQPAKMVIIKDKAGRHITTCYKL